jgi:hypothetical protein
MKKLMIAEKFIKIVAEAADQIENRIFANAVDLGNPGLDNLYGYGKLFIPSPLYLPLIFR